MSKKENQLVVVLSRNYSTGLSVVRSLGSVGYKVDLVSSCLREGGSAIAAKSKYIRKSVEIVSKKVKEGEDEELLNALLAYKGKRKSKIPLFPVDDYSVFIMDSNRDILSDIFVMPTILNNKQGDMINCMDKSFQGQTARACGIPTAKEWKISLAHEVAIPHDMIYPCICKPIESISGYKKEIRVCEDEEQLERHLNRLKKSFADRSVLVQQFLEIDNEIDLSGVCLDQEIIIPAMIRKTRVAQYEKGVTLAGRVVPFEEIGDLYDKIIKMMQFYHYNGMFDLEFHVVGDKLYFNEINFRSGGPNFSYFMSGVNLPALVVKELLGEKHLPEEEKVEAYGKEFVYEKVAWEDYLNDYLTKAELKELIANADITILGYEEDPEPLKLFNSKMKKRYIKKQLRWLKRILWRRPINKMRRLVRPFAYIFLRYPQTKKENERDPEAMQPRVLVVGRNYCSNLGIARALGKAGYEVEVMRLFQVRPKIHKNPLRLLKPDCYSKYVKAYYKCVSRRRSRRIFNRLKKVADLDNKMLLIPADDLAASVIDRYLEELQEFYITPSVDHTQGKLTETMSKGVQKELAKKAGLPVLNSCVIKSENHEFEIPDSVTYPCFIKPNISKNSSKSRMKMCESEEVLRETLTSYCEKKDFEMLVEDFVDIDKEYSILGVSTEDGVVSPGYFRAEVGGQLEHRGVALVGRMLDTEEEKELIQQITDFIGTLKFNGLFDVDLIKTKQGKMYFVELNLRFGSSGYGVLGSGVNLPGMFADYMIHNKPLDFDCKIEKAGKTFVSEKVLIEEYMQGRIDRKELKRLMDQTDIHMIEDSDDPVPYKHFKKFYLVAAVMRPLIKLKERREDKKTA